jgi:hypothetical protein
MTPFRRIKALVDTSAWILIAPSLIALFFIDESMLTTLVQWLVFAPVLAGVAVIVSRIVFPQIHLTDLVSEAMRGNRAAATVAGALVIFVAILVLALAIWSRA